MDESICIGDFIDQIPFYVLFNSSLHKEIKAQARQRRMKFSDFINDVLREAMFFLDKVSLKIADLPCDDYGEKRVPIKIKRKLLIDRDLKYKLFHFQNYFKLRSKGAVLRFLMRMYLRKLGRLGEDGVKLFIERNRSRWLEQLEKVKVWKRWVNPERLKNYHRGNFLREEVVNNFSYVMEIRLL